MGGNRAGSAEASRRRPRRWRAGLWALAFSPLAFAVAFAEDEAPLLGDPDASRCRTDGVGLSGYDPVSYRSGDAPRPGRPELTMEFGDVTYRFATEANRRAFRADPKRYLPRYGGWCAMTLAMGRLACPDVLNFRIQDDSLLLFETTVFTNGRVVWNRIQRRIRNAPTRTSLESNPHDPLRVDPVRVDVGPSRSWVCSPRCPAAAPSRKAWSCS